MYGKTKTVLEQQPEHFLWSLNRGVATITLNRPGRKNPLTFESYAEMRDLFRELVYLEEVKAVVITGAGGNFCSGGDVHEIIGPLTKMSMKELLAFTRMTGDLVKAIKNCPQPVIAAIDGICVGAGAILAMASDIRLGTRSAKISFIFSKVGLAGCDMGACAILPRIIGQGRAAELLFSGRNMSGEEAERWGFFNQLHESKTVLNEALEMADRLVEGPNFAHGITKTMLNQEWSMSIEQAIESEAQAQAICMQTEDFVRAYEAFVKKEKPVFEGN
jgi:enoyl-CoA hydratase/carnithine racemase